jgi:hypothetical protein
MNPTIEEELIFKYARLLYHGTKRGLKTELYNFINKHKDWREVLPLIQPAIRKEISVHSWLRGSNRFEPPWKHFQTWINQRCWENEFPDYEAAQNGIRRNSTPASTKTLQIECQPAPIEICDLETRKRLAKEAGLSGK